MKNAEIIESHAIALMEDGIIKSAGKAENYLHHARTGEWLESN